MRHPDQDPCPHFDPELDTLEFPALLDESESPAPIAEDSLPGQAVRRLPGQARRPALPAALAVFALYALLFIALEPLVGLLATTLAAAPAVVAAWFWGSRGAAACAIVLLLLHALQPLMPWAPPPLMSLYTALQAAALALISGGGVGLLRDRDTRQRTRLANTARRLVQLERSLQDDEPLAISLPGEPGDLLDRLDEPGGKRGEDPEALLFQIAFYDQLTGLPNRALLVEKLSALLLRRREDQRDVALLLLDLDRFKVINDCMGPVAGDRLLAETAKRIRAVSGADALVARLGSDEFAVVLEDGGVRLAAVDIAQRILNVLDVGFTIGGLRAFTSASIGVVLADDQHEHPRDLVRDAELAMTQAKLSGGARYALFDRSLRDQRQQRAALEGDLRVALHRRQLQLAYQPIVSLCDGEVLGFEALVRWRHPLRGLISPSTFIPMAEETGVIVPLGGWVIDTACDHLARWHRGPHRHRPLQVNVNVSPRQLNAEGLGRHITTALSSRGLPAERLALEITESAMVGDSQRAGEVLQELRRERIQLCVDDFGTGYSSLSQLLRFPADTLKIDRSFVERLAWREEDAAVVQTIVRLSHNLGMSVVAEGIETPEQLQLLRELGCEKGQGYLFARPMSPEAAGELLSAPPPWSGSFR